LQRASSVPSEYDVLLDGAVNQSILVEQSAAVLKVTLNRPESHNAFNPDMVAELKDTFTRVRELPGVRVIVLTGRGASFCAGADLATMRAAAARDLDDNRAESRAMWEMLSTVDTAPVPVVGRVNGPAFGGGVGLICCCDVVVAIESARFAFSEVLLGLAPAVISPFVVAKIGFSQARALFLTGESFDAQRARAIGFVHQVVTAEEMDSEVDALTERLLSGAPGAQSTIKGLLRSLGVMDPDEQAEYTSELIARLRAGEEGQEGLGAFLEKRRPNWTS
jgi:methylglutaconyl-CoA hydratase